MPKTMLHITHLRTLTEDGTYEPAILTPCDSPGELLPLEEFVRVFDTPDIYLWKPRVIVREDDGTELLELNLHRYVDLDALSPEMRVLVKADLARPVSAKKKKKRRPKRNEAL